MHLELSFGFNFASLRKFSSYGESGDKIENHLAAKMLLSAVFGEPIERFGIH